MWCTQCGAQLEEGANFCHNCGTQCEPEIQEEAEDLNGAEFEGETVVYCPNCGASLFPDDAFCNQCGAPVSKLHSEKEEDRCPECNTEYQPGAQFCSTCGTPLGQASNNTSYIQASSHINILSQILEFIRSYFKRPVETTLSTVEEQNNALPAALFIIYALSCGVQLYAMFHGFCDTIESLLQDLFGVFAMTLMLEVPFFASMLFGILYSALFILLMSLSFYCCSKILRENCSIGTALRTTLSQSIVPSIFMVLAAAATLISPWAGILIYFLSQIAWIVLMVLGLSTLSAQSQSGRFWFPFILVLFAGLLIFNFIVSQTIWSLVQEIAITYDDVTMTIREIMESEEMTEANEFFEAVLGDLF